MQLRRRAGGHVANADFALAADVIEGLAPAAAGRPARPAAMAEADSSAGLQRLERARSLGEVAAGA